MTALRGLLVALSDMDAATPRQSVAVGVLLLLGFLLACIDWSAL